MRFFHSVQRRRAEPCVAQRAAAVGALRDWLPAIYAAAHCITSYPVGPFGPVPTFRILAARKPRGWDPSTKRPVVWPKGGTVTIHPALTAADAATDALVETFMPSLP